MRRFFISIGSLALGIAACGDDSGGGTGGDSGSTSSTTTATTSTGSGVTSSSTSTTTTTTGTGGQGGEGGVGTGGAGTGGDTGTGGATGTGGDTGTGGAGTGGATGTGGAGTGGATGTGGAAGTGGAGGAACDGVELTVKNYLAWCDVTVADGDPFGGAEQTVCVPEGTVDLAASAQPGFILGDDMWHHTDGDPGTGEPGEVVGELSSATVTVSGSTACVWVCCPFANGSGCDVPDQCP